MDVTDRISCSVFTQIILNQPIAINAHKKLKPDNSMKGILQYIAKPKISLLHCVTRQKGRIDVFTKCTTHRVTLPS